MCINSQGSIQETKTREKFVFWIYGGGVQFCPPGGATYIAILPMISLLASSVGIELLSSSARVTSVKSQQHVLHDSCHKPDP